MNWAPDEMQQAVTELARKIFETSTDPWTELQAAGLLDLESLPHLGALLVESGRAGGRTPLLETLILGGPIRGEAPGTILTAGLLEPASRNPRHVQTVVRDGRAYGTKICVPVAERALKMVVPAQDGLYVVALSDCTVELQVGTNEEVLGTVTMDGARAERLDVDLETYLLRVDIGISALLLGLAKEALQKTANYVREREQFGRKIGTFQAVSQRCADAWIETQAMEVTLWQAAWRLEAGLPAAREVAIARYTAAEGAHRVLATAQHLHGGMGFDRDYPLYRYFLTVKAWEFVMGGASAQLERLGGILAAGTTVSAG